MPCDTSPAESAYFKALYESEKLTKLLCDACKHLSKSQIDLVDGLSKWYEDHLVKDILNNEGDEKMAALKELDRIIKGANDVLG